MPTAYAEEQQEVAEQGDAPEAAEDKEEPEAAEEEEEEEEEPEDVRLRESLAHTRLQLGSVTRQQRRVDSDRASFVAAVARHCWAVRSRGSVADLRLSLTQPAPAIREGKLPPLQPATIWRQPI